MAYRDDLWAAMEPVYLRVLEHPFLGGLTDGTLPRDRFRHFVVQDGHYLREYARALSVCGAKAPTEADTAMFAAHAGGAITVEQEMHAGFLAELDDPSGEPRRAAAEEPVLPTTLAYSSYLLSVTHQGSFAEGLGAVLPCYWVYARVGGTLLERSSPDPLYRRWIDTYGGEDFQKVVAEVLALVDRVGTEASDAEKERVRGHVVTTTRYEYMFWDAAWRLESWPV
ncbi:MAG: thiaminase II [Actinomycetes bacterium]